MKKLTRVNSWCSALLVCAIGLPVQAAKIGDMDLSLNGFMTIGMLKGDNDVAYYYNTVADDFEYDFDAIFGLRLGLQVNDRTSVAFQIRTESRGDNEITVDWAYVDYEINDETHIRGGRIAMPLYLISEVKEVGYAYPWIRPPTQIYNVGSIHSMQGFDMLYRFEFAGIDWLVQPYVGSEDFDSDSTTGTVGASVDSTLTRELDGLYGMNILGETSWGSFRAGYTDTDVIGRVGGAVVLPSTQATFLGLGFTVDWHNIVSYNEFIRLQIDGPSPDRVAWYSTIGYRFGKWLPHVTYGRGDGQDKTGKATLTEDSTTLGVRYEVSNQSSLKVEWQQIDTDPGTLGFGFSTDPIDTVNIVSIAFDMVF